MKRILLLAGAIGWGVSLFGVVLPWRVIDVILRNMGAAAPVTDPMIRYWFCMAFGAWSMIGFFYLAAFLAPKRYGNLIPLLAVGTLAEGILLFFFGWLLDVPRFPCVGDVGFCLMVGGGLLIAVRGWPKVRYPLLAGRTSDASVWKSVEVDPAITAAFLEAVAEAFMLELPDLFRLRPTDSLYELYDSVYHTSRRHRFFVSPDDMELENCCRDFEVLCRFSGTEFDYTAPLHDLLRTIAADRDNQPPTDEEIKSLGITMYLLPYLTR